MNKYDKYHYDQEASMYSYIQIPKILLDALEYAELSAHAILLYALMLDRMSLSERNGWQDANGRTYIYYTVEEAMRRLHVRSEKITKMYKELEAADLIERKKQGQGKPAIIYVLKFTNRTANRTSKPSKIESQKVQKSKILYNSKNKTDKSNPESIIRHTPDGPAAEPPTDWKKRLTEQLPGTDPAVVAMMAEACSAPSTRINRHQTPAKDLQTAFQRLTDTDVSATLAQVPSKLPASRRRAYILTALYNTASAPAIASTNDTPTTDTLAAYVRRFNRREE